jgi:hypothetical protein
MIEPTDKNGSTSVKKFRARCAGSAALTAYGSLSLRALLREREGRKAVPASEITNDVALLRMPHTEAI